MVSGKLISFTECDKRNNCGYLLTAITYYLFYCPPPSIILPGGLAGVLHFLGTEKQAAKQRLGLFVGYNSICNIHDKLYVSKRLHYLLKGN